LWATANPAVAAAPSAPAAPTVTADNTSVDVTWKTVTSSPVVTAYTLATLNSDGTALISTISVDAASGDDASVTVTGLTNGTAYTFRVTAVNAQGSGTATSASSAVTPVTTPGTPTALSGTADDTSVVLNWTAFFVNVWSSI